MAEAYIQNTKSFDPVSYSVDENKFLLEHLGEPPTVAMTNPLPKGASFKAINDAITHVYELIEMEKHRGVQWVGVEALKGAITTYLTQLAKWEHDAKFKGAPRFPSMYVFTDKGLPIAGGVGADSGRVYTYFDEHGNRHPLAIPYQGDVQTGQWKPEWVAAGEVPNPDQAKGAIIETIEKQRLECPVCGHTESYKADSNSSKNAARARMSRHFKTAKDPVLTQAHREAQIKEFGGKVAVEGQ